MIRILLAWLLVLAPIATGAPAMAQPFDSRAYIDRAIALVRENALAADRVDWDRVTADMHRRAATARSPFDLYPALVDLLDQLGDQHSFLQLDAERAAAYEADQGRPFRAASANRPASERHFFGRTDVAAADRQVGGVRLRTIVVPSLSGPRPVLDAYAAALHEAVTSSPRPCGYALDFRGNGGGNMWPMLAGVSPLLGNGDFGAFVDRAGREAIFLRDGAAATRPASGVEQIVQTVEGWQSDAALLAAPVAVLIDGGSGSSGEIVPILFVGRPATRFFGTPSYGASTSTEGFLLPDGANLVIATAGVADRSGRIHSHGIRPDEEVRYVPGAADAPLDAATAWLAAQPACRAP